MLNKPKKYKQLNLIDLFIKIWENLNFKKRYQFFLILGIMFLSSLIEIASLTTIIPFIKALTDPNTIMDNKFILGILDIFGYSSNEVGIYQLATIFTVTLLIGVIIRVINAKLNTLYAASVGSLLSCKAFKNILERPYLEHLLAESSTVITSSTTHMERTVVSFNFFLQFLTYSVISLSIVITLVYIEWSILLLSLSVLCLAYFFQIYLSKNRLSKNSKEFANASKRQVRTIQEGLGTIRDLIIHKNMSIYLKEYKSYDVVMRSVMAENTFIKLYPRFIIEFLGTILIILAGLILSRNPVDSQNAIAALGTFALGCQRLLPSLQQIYSSWAGIKANYGSMLSVISILDEKKNSTINTSFDRKNAEKFKSLELKNISMRYSKNSPFIFKNFNFTINRGEIVGILGKTGCGKSTLMDIMMGLIEPVSGNIFFNGKDINMYSNLSIKYNLHHLIAHVPQNIFLCNSTFKENIALGQNPEDINMNKIIKSAKSAKIHDYIISNKEGYDTYVGESGNTLSGGQKQRIAIARAFYRDAEILFLDEATSALDENTEEEINLILDSMGKEITVIKIAHRIKTLENCDKIIDLNNII